MKIYLAARYSRYPEMQRIAAELEALGHTVTSRWICGTHWVNEQGLSIEQTLDKRQEFAIEDLADCMAADCQINFTEAPRSGNSRGGRHVEFGVAVALGQRLIVIGHRENIFHCLPSVGFCESWQQAKERLTA